MRERCVAANMLHGVFEGGVDGQRMHVRPRHHHLAHLDLAEFHRVLNERDFGRGQEAAVARLL